MAQKATVTISGGFYTVITVQIDVFESRIIDERHFATEEEAKEHQRKTIFNSENNAQMAAYAMKGIRIYFVGFLFAGCNIVGAGYLSATEKAGWAFAVSIVRGVVAIIACAVILAYIFGMTGVWLAFPVAEGITTMIMLAAMKQTVELR